MFPIEDGDDGADTTLQLERERRGSCMFVLDPLLYFNSPSPSVGHFQLELTCSAF